MDWLYFKTPAIKSPIDKQAIDFGRYGEFAPEADIAFEEHLDRLKKLNNSKMFKAMNGKRLKELNKTEPFKYWRP